MRVRLNPGGFVDEYQYSDEVRITKQWQTVTSKIGRALLQSKYKGRSLVEVEEAEGREAEAETPQGPSEDAEQEGES